MKLLFVFFFVRLFVFAYRIHWHLRIIIYWSITWQKKMRGIIGVKLLLLDIYSMGHHVLYCWPIQQLVNLWLLLCCQFSYVWIITSVGLEFRMFADPAYILLSRHERVVISCCVLGLHFEHMYKLVWSRKNESSPSKEGTYV